MANNEFSFPQNNRSGTRINSSTFINPTIEICAIAFNLDWNLLITQIAINSSDRPINMVKTRE